MLPRLAVSKRFVAVALVLTAVGVFALVVGSHDVFAARGLSSRLFGAMLAAAGLLMVVAAAGVFGRTTWHLALSLVGSFAALLVGVALLLAQIDAGGRSQMLVIWAAVVIAALVALALSLRSGVAHVSSAVRRVQLAAAGGILIGIAQFVFTNVYGPTPGGPTLNVTSALERVDQTSGNDGLVPIRARITINNTSQRKILLVDSYYTVTGSRVTRRDDHLQFYRQLVSAAKSADPVQDEDNAPMRDAAEAGGVLLRAEQVIPRGEWFEPGESITRQFIVYAPARRFDLLHLVTVFELADYGRLSLGDEPMLSKREKRLYFYRQTPYAERYSVVTTEWKVHETSWVRRLIRGDNVLWVSWLIGPRRRPQLSTIAYVDRAGASYDPWPNAPFPRRVIQLDNDYGLIATESAAELSLRRFTGGRQAPR